MKNALSLVVLVVSLIPLHCQDIVSGPYLQDAKPTSIHIMWESSEDVESMVIWGLTENLGDTAHVSESIVNKRPSQVHRVNLSGLSPSTRYYYKVQMPDQETPLFHFDTPPVAHDTVSFKLVAMSDMQRDDAQPDKFKEMVEEGLISYLAEGRKDPFEDLGMFLIPGDLVDDGLKYTDWTDDFFRQSTALLPYVPVYPVLGNHERNSPFYFNYFHLPDNGSPGYREHWWYKDYANVRIIGLDSNEGYRIVEQLDWLDEVLKATETVEEIDFVFAQLHHPHKSELWQDGELDYTGEIIYRLEQFSTRTGKPTIHFYGHTHGYSRGQSMDHTHLWVNVATAGGRIDGWGEYVQNNHDEFPVSHSDYGFVLLEVDDGDDPRFKLIRVSRGDVSNPLDNEVKDVIEVARYAVKPEAPKCVTPLMGAKLDAGGVLLEASQFMCKEPSSELGESHWQLSRTNNFANPELEYWNHHMDWYGGEDLQEGADLSKQKVDGLRLNTTYHWRVRYRSKGLAWSPWSRVQQFETY
jgi:hypothetical protein